MGTKLFSNFLKQISFSSYNPKKTFVKLALLAFIFQQNFQKNGIVADVRSSNGVFF